jgi:hypothetical protein
MYINKDIKKLTIDVDNAIILLYLIFIILSLGSTDIKNIPDIGINSNNISSIKNLKKKMNFPLKKRSIYFDEYVKIKIF